LCLWNLVSTAEWQFNRNEEVIEKIRNRKGKFIIATNILDKKEITDQQIIEIYLYKLYNIIFRGERFIGDRYSFQTVSSGSRQREIVDFRF
jgi:hypothetical protein